MIRQFRLSAKQFKQIFPSRTIGIKEKLGKSFYFVQKKDTFYLEERDSLTSRVISLLVIPIFLPVMVLWYGLRCIPELIGNQYDFMVGKYTRIDMCHNTNKSTDELKSLSGWYSSDNQRV
jgi:hypothetical protein